jgi:hypothetical protein
MTKRKEVDMNEQKKRSNQTANLKAMAVPEVQKLVNDLKSQWESLSPQARGEKLDTLLGFKCSVLGIAREVQQPARNMYRYIEQARASKADSAAIMIEADVSNKNLPAQKASVGPSKISPLPSIEVSRAAAQSDELATLILECFRIGMPPQRVTIPVDSIPTILNAVAGCLSGLEASGGESIPPKTWTGGPFSKTRPAEAVLQADWIANTIWAETRRRTVWESALKKVIDRDGDPVINKRPIEKLLDNQKEMAERKMAEIVPSPMRRRPIEDARSVMQWQGRPTAPVKPD